MTFLRTLMLLALIVWIGGLIFFVAVLAPTVFIVLPSTQLAGNVVARSLTALHWMGMVSGMVFLVCSLFYSRARHARARPFLLANVAVAIMLLLTVISQFGITPRMHVLRAQMAGVENLSATDGRRQEFDQLHQWSTRTEGAVLVLGLAVVVLTARRFA